MHNKVYAREHSAANLENIERVCNYIYELNRAEFFGDLVLKFQDGEIVLVDKHQSFKPNFLVVVEQHRI